jgi:hypothetical protein
LALVLALIVVLVGIVVVAIKAVVVVVVVAVTSIAVPRTMVHGSFVHVFYRLAKTIRGIEIPLFAEQHDTEIVLGRVNIVDAPMLMLMLMMMMMILMILIMMLIIMLILVEISLLQFINSDMLEFWTLFVHGGKIGETRVARNG